MNTSSEARIDMQLAALPQLELPERLWPRVSAARKRRVRQRRAIALGGGVLAALAIVLPNVMPPAPALSPAPSTVVHAPSTPYPAHVRLRSVDLMIQAAYNRGASDAEIAALLSARRTLLGNPAAAPALPVSI